LRTAVRSVHRERTLGGPMSDANDVVDRFYTMWAERDLDLAYELFEPDFRAVPIAHESRWQGQGPASMRHHTLSWLLGMPDLRMTELRRVRQADTVVSHWEMAGIHKGDLYGVPATGLRLRCEGVTWFVVRGERIVELRTSFDALGFLQQLGVLPDSAAILASIANSSRP